MRAWVVCAAALLAACQHHVPQSESALASFCDRLPRPEYAAWPRHPASDDWFEVYEVAPATFAIYEPWQWQEVISYLMIGAERSLLFDTGNGIGDIAAVVDRLTSLPVTVINSHSHIDHIGGNHQFSDIASVDTAFSRTRAHGVADESVLAEVSEAALCRGLPAGVDASRHRIEPFTAVRAIADGDVIDIGAREFHVLLIPGHTDDSIALHEPGSGLLWTGDSFYAGPIWLFAPETDTDAYYASLQRLAALVPDLRALLPAHNTPWVTPARLTQAVAAFEQMMAGGMQPVPAWDDAVTYEFEGFGFLIRKDLVPGAQ
ncbi:MAG: MBL fold metallo-hydrolase [Pseudomonadota bacterium]